MNAAVPIVFLTIVTAGSLLTAVAGRLRRGAAPASGDGCPRPRCYLGVTLTPVGDRTLIVVGGVGAVISACVPARDGAERTPGPGGAVTDAAERSGPAETARVDALQVETLQVETLQVETAQVETAWVETELLEILRAEAPQRAADLSPSGSSNRTASR